MKSEEHRSQSRISSIRRKQESSKLKLQIRNLFNLQNKILSMFSSITFWCEFPKTTNWDNLNKLINFKANIYIASSTKEEFLKYKSKIKNKYIQIIGAWPILKKEQGYWFSSYTYPNYLIKLKEFDDIPLKIDLEAPIYLKSSTVYQAIAYFLKYFILNKGKYQKELEQTIESLKQPVIISTFPMPKFLLRNIGYFNSNCPHNFFVYISLIPRILKPLFRFYYKSFIKSKIKNQPETMFAIGCTGPGIFGNEKFYNHLSEFKKDLDMLKNLNVKNAVIFEISSLLNKPDTKEWFNLIKSYL